VTKAVWPPIFGQQTRYRIVGNMPGRSPEKMPYYGGVANESANYTLLKTGSRSDLGERRFLADKNK
jgi:hypothetical protein